jgi:hypothetical protein
MCQRTTLERELEEFMCQRTTLERELEELKVKLYEDLWEMQERRGKNFLK